MIEIMESVVKAKVVLTIEALHDPSIAGKVIARGITTNDENGLFMTGHKKGEALKWILKVGHASDWAIYCHWAANGWLFVEENGDKPTTKEFIENIVQMDSQVWQRYRV